VHAVPNRGIAVVVPTLDRSPAVRRLFQSLRRSMDLLPRGIRTTLVAVDDSNGDERQRIERHCAEHDVVYLRGPRNVGAKRNIGVAATSEDVVLFVDSDCVASPDLLPLHLAGHGQAVSSSGRPVVAVAGPAIMEGAPASFAWRAADASRLFNSAFTWPLQFTELEWAPTCNLSVTRQAFTDVGGFAEHPYTVVGGEDVDFGVRLYAAGYTTVAAPGAIVIHSREAVTGVRPFYRKLFMYGRACVWNCHRQPAKSHWSPNPLGFVGVGALSTIATRRPVLAWTSIALAGAAFARDTSRQWDGCTGGLAEAAFGTTIDWAYYAGIVAESLRRGTPQYVFKRYRYLDDRRTHNGQAP
jgi:GT2 family glycosyltransferase